MPKMPFQIMPVIDVLNGQAVHAIGGRRAHYQPICSILHASSEPIPLACALRDRLGLHSLYLADLDAIAGDLPRIDIFGELIARGLHLWVDAGVRDVRSLTPLLELDSSAMTIVVGLETIDGPLELREVVERAGAERVVFSLDLFEGIPRIAAPAAWGTTGPFSLAGEAIDGGVRQVLILDLARVGTSRGLGTNTLMTQVREAHPSVRLTVGGGISRIEEVVALRVAGATAVLVGSAIHHGRIGARELAILEDAGE